MPTPATPLSWHDAPAALLAAARAHPHSITLLGITGPVGSGKSTLARRLSTCILATDDYLPDYDTLPYHDRDRAEHVDVRLLREHLAALRIGKPAAAPVWSFHTHRREGVREIAPAPTVVVEGIHALHEPIAELLDLRVFVEAPPAVRWARWEKIESSGERGWGVEVAREYFHAVAEPTFHAAAPAYRARADYIVLNVEQE